VAIGFGKGLVLHLLFAGLPALLARLAAFLLAPGLFIGFFQVLYLGPLVVHYRRRGLVGRRRGVTLLAALTFLLNVACFGWVWGSLWWMETHRRQPSALLITLDTTRADALSCYGNPHGTTPYLDRLAAEGIRFDSAHTTVPLTLPAHTSMLTGLVPPRHGLRDNGIAALSPEARTLAEVARERGFQTAAFVGSIVLDPGLGLAQGFDVYDAPLRPWDRGAEGVHGAERPASEVVDRALEWLAERDPERPFFLWVHVYDPHDPYAPPVDFDATAFEDAYLAEVAYADREIGRLLDVLREDGTLDDTIVVATSDHGEGFGAHGEVTHGVLCFEEMVHVPLIVRPEGGLTEGRVSSANVSVVDVFGTLLGGSPVSDGIDLQGPVPPDRGTYVESMNGWLYYGWSPIAGWIDEDGKALLSSSPLLFDLASDPREQRDLSGERPEGIAAARTAIAELLARPALEPVPAGAEVEGLLDDLGALGYAGGSSSESTFPSPLDPSDRPAPHVAVGYLDRYGRAQELERAGRLEEALAIHAAEARANPLSATAWLEKGRLELSLRRPAEAVASLERAVACPNPKARDFFGLGTALAAAGRPEDAVAPLREAVVRSRGRPQYVQGLAQVLQALGRTEELAELRRTWPVR
jgi:choline-sulfatase